jgi:phosphoribosyl-ATP pyrophosphohydrolase/phosphoribosyl-AMP cyclohydrolase
MDKNTILPAIVQDYKTKEVLMLAYMNMESLKKSLKEGYTWFWSRSKNRLWKKGETSGNTQKIKGMHYDCDNDAILVLVEQKGEACHTGNMSCFYRELKDPETDIDFGKDMKALAEDPGIITELYEVIKNRISEKSKGSYTYSLHQKGIEEILKKIGEEAIEVIIAAKHQEKKDMIYETGDLIYHLLVLMAEEGIKPADIFKELRSRRK